VENAILYEVNTKWPGKVETPDAIAPKFLATLDELERLNPTFRDWGSTDDLDAATVYAIAPLRAKFADYVRAHVREDDYGKPSPGDGYWFFAVSGLVPETALAPRRACFQVQAGSEFRNFSVFEIGSDVAPPDLSMITFDLFKSALLTMIAIWPVPCANARVYIWGGSPPSFPGEPPFPYSGFQMPWMTYLDASTSARFSFPAGVETEATPDGGRLMIATRDRFDPNLLAHLRPSRLIAQALIDQGIPSPGP
jgi:hypothetical protein